MSTLLAKGVRSLPRLSVDSTEKVKRAASVRDTSAAPPGEHPGIERWPVKTGTDADVSQVGQNVVNGEDLGQGIVQTTVEEMLALPRAANMPAVNDSFPVNSFYQDHRSAPTETTIWEITATITEGRLEQDGDYHLVLKGDSGQTMIGEVPNPDPAYVGNAAWLAEIKNARDAVDKKLGRPLDPADSQLDGTAPPTEERTELGPIKAEIEAEMTSINARATITGVGFFDSSHGQTGVAPSAIEIHPVFSIVFL